jgi:hypothetical protein
MICVLCRIILKVSIYFWVSSVAHVFDKLWGNLLIALVSQLMEIIFKFSGNQFREISGNSTKKVHKFWSIFPRVFPKKVHEDKTQDYYFSSEIKGRVMICDVDWLTQKTSLLLSWYFCWKNLNFIFWTIRYFHFIFVVLNFERFLVFDWKVLFRKFELDSQFLVRTVNY